MAQTPFMHRVLVIFATGAAVSCQVTLAKEPQAAHTIQQLADDIVNKPPATYFSLATELYREGQKNEAGSNLSHAQMLRQRGLGTS